MHAWTYSLRPQLKSIVPISDTIHRAKPLHDELSKKPRPLQEDDRGIMQHCIAFEQAVIAIDQFFKAEYQAIVYACDSLKEDTHELFAHFYAILKANVDEKYLVNQGEALDINAFIDNRFNQIITDAVQHALSNTPSALTPKAIENELHNQWPRIIDHMFRQSSRLIAKAMRADKRQTSKELPNASVKNPVFWQPKNITSIRAFDTISHAFVNDDYSVEEELKKIQQDIIAKQTQLSRAQMPEQRSSLAHELGDQMQRYHQTLMTTQLHVEKFVQWFVSQHGNFTALIDFLAHFDNDDPSVQDIAYEMKGILYVAMMQAFDINEHAVVTEMISDDITAVLRMNPEKQLDIENHQERGLYVMANQCKAWIEYLNPFKPSSDQSEALKLDELKIQALNGSTKAAQTFCDKALQEYDKNAWRLSIAEQKKQLNAIRAIAKRAGQSSDDILKQIEQRIKHTPVLYVKAQLQTCISAIKQIKQQSGANDKKEAQPIDDAIKSNSPSSLACVAQYVQYWQGCLDAFENMSHQSMRVNSDLVQKQLADVVKKEKAKFKKEINKRYAQQSSVIQLKTYYSTIKFFEIFFLMPRSELHQYQFYAYV